MLRLQGVCLLWPAFPDRSPEPDISDSNGMSYNPKGQALWFGLFPFRSPLLRKSHLLSLPPGTEMFQFPGSALPFLWIQKGILPVRAGGFPIRKSPDQRLLTAPRSLSEFVPSFIGS